MLKAQTCASATASETDCCASSKLWTSRSHQRLNRVQPRLSPVRVETENEGESRTNHLDQSINEPIGPSAMDAVKTAAVLHPCQGVDYFSSIPINYAGSITLFVTLNQHKPTDAVDSSHTHSTAVDPECQVPSHRIN